MKKLRIPLLFLIFALLLSACTSSATPTVNPTPTAFTIDDAVGTTLSLNGTAKRIVSLAPSNTEMLFAIGAGDLVVGRDEFSNYPLGYKILRLVNSAQYGISTTITSIHQAIAMIGLEPLRGWLTLLLLSNTVDKPEELTIIAMLRAKMCELLARRTGQRTASSFFLVGLLSVLDALMDLPMTEVLDHIPLSKDITDALFYGAGRPGEALKCVLAYERGDWDRVCFSGLSANQIREIYLDAVDWAENISHSVVTANAAPAPKH